MNIPPELLPWRRWLATVWRTGVRALLWSPDGGAGVPGPSVRRVAPYLPWLWATFKTKSTYPCRRQEGERGGPRLRPPGVSGQVCVGGGWTGGGEVRFPEGWTSSPSAF